MTDTEYHGITIYTAAAADDDDVDVTLTVDDVRPAGHSPLSDSSQMAF